MITTLYQRICLFILFFLSYCIAGAQDNALSVKGIDFNKLRNSHDVSLSPWGPYSKKYAGVSHISDVASGMRFDFSVMPGYYRNKVLIPNVRFESSYFPWEFNANLKQFTYRYELEWKDKVYVDVTYIVRDSVTVLVKMHSVNQSALTQNLVLNLMSFVDYPENYSVKKMSCARGAHWYNALSYQSLTFAKKTARDNLVYDGWLLGEARQSDFIDGRALSKGFGENAGDSVKYQIDLPADQLNGKMSLVYKVKKGMVSSFRLSGLINTEVSLKGTGQFETIDIPFLTTNSGSRQLVFVALGSAGAELNGFVISDQSAKQPFKIEDQDKNFIPETEERLAGNNMILKYRDVQPYYGIGWDSKLFQVREFRNSELDIYFKNLVHNHVEKVFTGDKQGAFSNVFIRPIEMLPNSEHINYAIICSGNYQQVKERLDAFNTSREAYLPNKVDVSQKSDRVISEGKKYLFSQKMMQAALLSNVVYPVYTQNSYIRNFTPGKWWNSLYPRLRQLYLFLSGNFGSSTIGSLKSGLLKTWDYFYNSAGWDDYPPQVGVHQQKLEETTAPVSNTAHAIRVAKILRMFALKLGLTEHVTEYDSDIARFSKVLQSHSWDTKSGYFSYVKHDENGQAASFFNFQPGGVNFNMGLDGVSPLMAGICTTEQENVLLEKLISPKNLWTPAGISAVDQSAPYYKTDGYWNGSVWMPHQWFVWKTLLDLGKADLAYQLAQKALDVWKAETDASYYTFEHFLAKSGRGAGWHQFSGLSTPVLAWFSSYYKIGTVTAGFETLIEEKAFNKDNTTFTASLSFDTSTKEHIRTLLVCMSPDKKYKAHFNGKKVNFSVLNAGLLQISLPASNTNGVLDVKPI